MLTFYLVINGYLFIFNYLLYIIDSSIIIYPYYLCIIYTVERVVVFSNAPLYMKTDK